MGKTTGSTSSISVIVNDTQENKSLESLMIDVPSLDAFLATRFYPPASEGDYVERACILEILENVKNYRLVLLRAPAGYGKTTTASACYWALSESNGLTAWLNLTDFDAVSLIEFFGYLGQALSWPIANQTSLVKQWKNNRLDVPSVQSLSHALCNAASEYEHPVYLFLDDFDAIIGTEAESLIYQVLREAPANLHIIITSRLSPSFGLGRMRIRGQLAEIGVEQLRFTEEDAALLLAASEALNVNDQLVASAVKKTEGWAAGLQLVAILLAQSDDVQNLLSSFNGEAREVGEFLAEDVLASLDQTVIEFLLKTSILRRFCVPLCNAITGRDDSREIVDELEKRSLFISSLDGEGKWYRYQSLFADFLLRNLKEEYPDIVQSLHLKACEWHIGDGLIVQGVRHALLAEDFHRAASILDEKSHYLLGRGLVDTQQKLVSSIPEEVLSSYPSLRLWKANYAICYRRFKEAEPILAQVEEYIAELKASAQVQSVELSSLSQDLLRAKMMLTQFMDDMPALERLCEEALSEANSTNYDGGLIGSLHASLLHAKREQYRLDQVEHHSSLAREFFLRSKHVFPVAVLESIVGPSYAQRGEFAAAEECYRHAIKLCDVDMEDNPHVKEGLYSLFADLQLERFEIDDARQLFERGSSVIQSIGFVDNLIAFFVGRARLVAFEGDWKRADRLLREGIDCAITQSLERLRWFCVDERIRQHLRRKDNWSALRVSSDSGLPSADTNLYPVGEFTTTREAMAMAWARTALAAGRPKDALKLLKRWLSFVERQRAVKSQIKLSMLTAQVYQAMGEIRSALRVLKDVMPHIAQCGMLFSLIEEGEALQGLILQACEVEDDNQTDLSFVNRVKHAIDIDVSAKASLSQSPVDIQQAEDVQSEVLNPKEIEILRLVARSKLNKEIAEQLGLTEGTVKWYLQQIYDKFGVRRRFAALERARVLGYL